MTTFKDSKGLEWSIEIKVRDIERVKAHVTGVNGQPVDLLDIAEKGDFSAVSGSLQTVLQVVFWLCFEEIMANFDKHEWDRLHRSLYEYLPEEQNKTLVQKAADWFGERIGGAEVLALVRAWEGAILNFIPNPRVQQAVRNVMEREEVYQEKLMEAAEAKALDEIRQNQAQLGVSSTPSPEKSE